MNAAMCMLNSNELRILRQDSYICQEIDGKKNLAKSYNERGGCDEKKKRSRGEGKGGQRDEGKGRERDEGRSSRRGGKRKGELGKEENNEGRARGLVKKIRRE